MYHCNESDFLKIVCQDTLILNSVGMRIILFIDYCGLYVGLYVCVYIATVFF